MPSKVYLIDTENVKSEWKCVLDKLDRKDKLLLFYTENSPNVSFADFSNLVNYPFKYEMLPCFLGKNGLDFQLVTYLGYLLRKSPLKEYVIISNDTGFDTVVYFWTGKGKKVSRLSTQALHGEEEKQPQSQTTYRKRQYSGRSQGTKKTYTSNHRTNTRSNEKQNRTAEKQNERPAYRPGKAGGSQKTKKRTPEKIQQDTTLKLKQILEVQKGIDFSWLYGELQKHTEEDLQEIHRSMVKKWGQEEGTALYKKLKPQIKEIYKVMKD